MKVSRFPRAVVLLVLVVAGGAGCDKPAAGPVAKPPSPSPPLTAFGGSALPPGVEGGRQLFKTLGCKSCHMVDGWGGQNAPDLTLVATRYTKLQGSLEGAKTFFREHIKDPEKNPGIDKKLYPFVRMPPIPMTDEEREQVIEYLSTLREK
ncbi:MAG: cytochrome c [Planctomycetes bacterium]|nr:cytochrome c [Planctomycetota bacterium]